MNDRLDAARLRRLIDAGRALVSQLDLDALLEELLTGGGRDRRPLRGARDPR